MKGPSSGGVSTSERILADDALNQQLLRDGFVTFPLMSPGDAATLREQFGQRRGWEGEGFCSDLVLDDPEYRREVNRVIGDAADDLVTSRFVGYTPFLHNFLVKFPGGDSGLYIHRDWMYVDERLGHHTYVAWIALDDITGHNGQLRVLRGSQDIDPMLRGTDLIAPWLSLTETIDERFLSVPVRAGECIVFDNRTVHASFPNHTDRPRVAVAVGMRPVDAPLVHFRRTGTDVAVRYDVTDDFFCTATPQELIVSPPDLPVAETVQVTTLQLDAHELAARLDRGVLAKIDRTQHLLHEVERTARRAAGTLAGRARRATTASATDRTGGSPGGPEPRRRWSVLTPGAAGTTRAAGPADGSFSDRVRAQIQDLPTKAAIAVLGLNEASINRFGPATPAIWDPSTFEWSARVEAGWPEILEEVRGLLEGPSEIPHIEEVTGGIPQGNIGPWRSFVLMHQDKWMTWNCERCPRTTEIVRSIPGLTVAGFSVLESGTHITEHRGPNKGALRYQLGVIVPGMPGDCRIRVGDEMIVWRDGEGVMFDFTVPHEAWNDSDEIRVLLMLEVITPLPWYLVPTNRMAQRAMGWFPTTRDMTNRLRKLEPSLRRAG